MQKSHQFTRHGPPARDGIPPLHSDEEALPEAACLSGVTRNDLDTPAELGDKLLIEYAITNCYKSLQIAYGIKTLPGIHAQCKSSWMFRIAPNSLLLSTSSFMLLIEYT